MTAVEIVSEGVVKQCISAAITLASGRA